MKLNDLAKKTSGWLSGTGPNANIVISTRVRLARNLTDQIFFGWADDASREETLDVMLAVFKKEEQFKDGLILRINDLSEVDRAFLVERHLMSKEHAVDVKHKALVIDGGEKVSAMLNEEDHIRLQALLPGLNIQEAWKIIDDTDNRLAKQFEFAYSNKFGYLTSCPTNTGTGLRASAMLHLAALRMTNQMAAIYDATSKLGLTIRGFYGEGSEALGDFFQISNQVTLGHAEGDIIDNLERVINKIVAREEDTRSHLIKNRKAEVSDNILRSFGTLKSARIITSGETIMLLSAVRLGVDMGLVKEVDAAAMNELMLFMQPAHLAKAQNKDLSSYERDVKRADLIRQKLGAKEC